MASRSPTTDVPNASDEKVLRAIGRFHYLTSTQLTWLLFSKNSHSYTSESLTRLTRANYLEKTIMPREGEYGRAKSVWSLLTKGRTYLEGLGISLLPRVSHRAERSHTYHKHLKSINDTGIACEALAREGHVFIDSAIHERVFHRTPERVDIILGDKKVLATPVIADGWVDFRYGVRDRTCCWIELDRATEHVPFWVKKILRIIEYFESGGYEERFGTDSMTVMVVVVPDPGVDAAHRRDQLIRWTEQVLEKRGYRDSDWPDVFRFAAVDPGMMNPVEFDPPACTPQEFFFGRHWLTPFSDVPRALLEGAG